MAGNPKPGSSPLPLEGDSVSDFSMVNEGHLQHDSDMIIEEEGEEGMETGAPLDSAASEESTDQNPLHDSNPDKDNLLGPPTDVSVPRGHSDHSIALIVSLGEDDLWTSDICNSNGQ